MLRRYVQILHGLIICFSNVYAIHCPDDGWFPGSRSCYIVHEKSNMTFREAASWCDDNRGRLASLENEKDFNTVVSKMNATAGSNYWLGLVMKDRNSCFPVKSKECWVWADGTQMTWMKWDKDEPSDTLMELCGKIHFRVVVSQLTAKWRNDQCSNTFPFVCEKNGADPVNDQPVTPISDITSRPSTLLSTVPSVGVTQKSVNSTNTIPMEENNDTRDIIIGCVVGGVLVIVLILVVCFILYRRKKVAKSSTERSTSLHYERQGQHLTTHAAVSPQDQQGSAYENIAVVSNPPYTQPRPKSGTLNYVEVDFPNYAHNSPKATPKYEQVEYAEVVVDKSDSKVPVARRVSDLYTMPMKRMKNALKKKEQSSEVQSGAYDNACNKGPTV